MNESLLIVLCLFSLAVALVTLVLLVPIYGKVFFSKHSVEYRPIEEIAKIRQGLGMDEGPQLEEAETRARQMTERLFGAPKESNDPLRGFTPMSTRKKERPAVTNQHDDEARAHTDRDRLPS